MAIWPNPGLRPPMRLFAGRWPAAFMGYLVLGILMFVVASVLFMPATISRCNVDRFHRS